MKSIFYASDHVGRISGPLNGKKLKESKPLKDKQGRELKSLDWRGLFNLDKGTYTITESSHPD